MKLGLICAMTFSTFLMCSHVNAAAFDLATYQEADGAIPVVSGGDSVDPYFAIRALLSARQAGLDISKTAPAWIEWLLVRQQPDGSFPRFCRINGRWEVCAVADADDALVALWLSLLFASAQCGELPPAWEKSAVLAARRLDSLLDRKTGVYHISEALPVSLFMDNVEIYAALRDVGQQQRCMRKTQAARKTLLSASRLRLAINRTFHRRSTAYFEVSTQQATDMTQFYPGQVAQIYPVLLRMGEPKALKALFAAWMKRYGDTWLAQEHDVYPWGMVALAAHEVGDRETVACWLSQAQALRYGPRWNVLEEAAWQALQPYITEVEQCNRTLPVVPRPALPDAARSPM